MKHKIILKPKDKTICMECYWLKDGDIIDIDVDSYSINARLESSEIEKRKAQFKPINKPLNSRYLAQYQKLVSNASNGAVLDVGFFK